MNISKRELDFATTDVGKWCQDVLEKLEQDTAYFSEPSFTSDTDHFPDNLMPFTLTHMNYLAKHPEVNPRHYISNLRLRSRKLKY